MQKTCPTCPGSAIEYSGQSGESFCTQCGLVLEENTISAELTFVEGADGAARMIGQFVSADRSGIRMGGGVRHRRLNPTQSREETIANARRRIQELAIAIRGVNDNMTDQAVQWYKLALSQQFTQGRKQSHVIAACLYIVCRQAKTMHMLIDFSDVLHASVFSLGVTFMKLVRVLEIPKQDLPLVDPSLYMARFAAQLEFGDMTHDVTTDALRLVQRMQRDWIQTGRRPAGICGACLLIAARMHGFRRTQNEIIRVVKIGDVTLRKRLNEFADTPSADLTIDEFRSIELSTAANPPCYQAPRRHDENADELDEREIEQELINALQGPDLAEVSETWIDHPVDEDPSRWSDLDEEEINDFILTEEEQQVKAEIWEELNKDWLDEQELKRQRALQLAANGEAPSTKARRKRKAPPSMAPPERQYTSTADAIHDVINSLPKFSKKINYSAVKDMLS